MTKTEKIENLLVVLNIREEVEAMLEKAFNSIGAMYAEMPKTLAHLKQIFSDVQVETSFFDNMVLDMLQVYDKTYSEEEINLMYDFYIDPLYIKISGKSTVANNVISVRSEPFFKLVEARVTENIDRFEELQLEDALDGVIAAVAEDPEGRETDDESIIRLLSDIADIADVEDDEDDEDDDDDHLEGTGKWF